MMIYIQVKYIHYTKGTRYIACVKKKYLNENENVILVDDFLADGNAMLD
mgnify:CR=1 FL=1